MKKISIFLLLFTMNACAEQPAKSAVKSDVECEFSFDNLHACSYKDEQHNLQVAILTEEVADDEKLLTALVVTSGTVKKELSITPETSILDGDIGFISFADINFDSIPDLAITTSFGTPNLYFDYWIYNALKNEYIAVGNHPQFVLNSQTKTLTTTIKNSAADYKSQEWHWVNNELKKR